MSTPLVPVLTRKGLAAVANAQGTGLLATISSIAVGRGTLQSGVYKGYVPTDAATALQGEMARVPILSGARRDPSGFSVLALLPASSPGEYPINEVGFFLTDGTLFALWSEVANPLAYKSLQADVDLGFDLLLQAIPTNLLALSVLNPDVPDTAGALASGVAMMARLLIGQIGLIDRLNAAKL